MVNKAKIDVYKKSEGDIDSWERRGSKMEKSVITDSDWYTIGSLLQDLSLIKNKMASTGFIEKLSKKLDEECDSQETTNYPRLCWSPTNKVIHNNHP